MTRNATRNLICFQGEWNEDAALYGWFRPLRSLTVQIKTQIRHLPFVDNSSSNNNSDNKKSPKPKHQPDDDNTDDVDNIPFITFSALKVITHTLRRLLRLRQVLNGNYIEWKSRKRRAWIFKFHKGRKNISCSNLKSF